MNRLTDNDKKFGPITYAKVNWKRISFILSSGDNYDGVPSLNAITVYALGWVFRVFLPAIIRPFAQKVTAHGWDAETIKRLGRDHYFNYFEREYGFSLSDGEFFQLYYGIQSGFGNLPDGVKEQSWCKHLPWTQWRMVRHSYHNLDGSVYSVRKPKSSWEEQPDLPRVKFRFKDYDGEIITATCHIEEREWHKGEGWFKWLSWLAKPMIRRYLDMSFDKEMGPQKGSWKGGTIGMACDMSTGIQGDTPETAFRRFCQEEQERKGKKFKLQFLQNV